MKTILKNDQYLRVDDQTADYEVKVGNASYVSKSEWKLKVRDIKTEAQISENIKSEKTKTKKATKHLKLKEKQRK